MCECMCPQSPEEGLGSSGARVQGRSELANLVLGTKLKKKGPLKEWYVLLILLNFLFLGEKMLFNILFFFFLQEHHH